MKKLIDIAQLVGVVGVIGSLVFVALQIRQNTAAIRSQASQGLQDQVTAVYQMYITDPTLANILVKARSDLSNLTEEERLRFDGFWVVAFNAYQNLFTQIQEGVFDNGSARGWWQQLRNSFERPGIKEIWTSNAFIFPPAFRQFVETEVMSLEPTRAVEVQQ